MKVFLALDLYDNMVRVAASNDLAEKWLNKRALDTWGEAMVTHTRWMVVSKGTKELISDTSSWPYRIIEQVVLTEPTPLVTTLPNGLMPKPAVAQRWGVVE